MKRPQNFENLAKTLEGVTDEVVVSFAQTYRKTKRNVEAAAQSFGFQWQESESLPSEFLFAPDTITQSVDEVSSLIPDPQGQRSPRIGPIQGKLFS